MPFPIDSVAFDFLVEQRPGHVSMNESVQDYLHEMTLADNPPSGTYYAPEKDVDGFNLYDFIVAYSTNAYPDADINRDGSINSNDIKGFAEEFGTQKP